MPGLAFGNLTGQLLDISDLEFEFEDPRNTPLLAMAPKLGKPTSNLHSVVAKRRNRIGKTGVRDMTPGKEPAIQASRALVSTVPHMLVSAWAVGSQAVEISQGNVAARADLVAEEIADAIANLNLAIDEILGDDGDLVLVGGNSETGMETRGLGSFISLTPQATQPVPANFLSGFGLSATDAANLVYTGTLANTTEETLRDMAGSIWMQGRKRRNMALVCGFYVKKMISDWSIFRTVQGGQVMVRQLKQDLKDRELSNVVDLIDTDAGPIEIHLSGNLARPRTEDPKTVYAPGFAQNSRAYMIPTGEDAWGVGFARNPSNEFLPSPGGSVDRNGQVSAIFYQWASPIVMGKYAPVS